MTTAIVEHDLLHFDIDVRKGAVLDVRLNDVVLPLLVDNGSLNIAVEKVEGAGLLTLYRESIAAEVKLSPAGQVVLVLGFLGRYWKLR